MRVVARNTMYDVRKRYAFHIPEISTYEGDLVPAPKWAVPGTVCLTTGDSVFPVRMIDPSMIVSIDDVVAEERSSDTKTVVIAGSKGASYTVTITPKGRTCTCPGFSFRGACKHTQTPL